MPDMKKEKKLQDFVFMEKKREIVTSRHLLESWIVTRNRFKNCRLARKLPQGFSVCFAHHMPLGKLPMMSPIPRLLRRKHA